MWTEISWTVVRLTSVRSAPPNTGDSWQPVVGIGTIALALTTGILAWVTFRMVRWTKATANAAGEDVKTSTKLAEAAAKQAHASLASAQAAQDAAESASKQVELTRLTMETQIRPVMVDMLRQGRTGQLKVIDDANSPTVRCHVLTRNIGSGTALIRGLGIRSDSTVSWTGTPSNSIVAPGEGTLLIFSVPKIRSELQNLVDAMMNGTFSVELRYTDINGGQDTITRLDIHRDPLRVRQVYLFKPGESEPFASSGPSGDPVSQVRPLP